MNGDSKSASDNELRPILPDSFNDSLQGSQSGNLDPPRTSSSGSHVVIGETLGSVDAISVRKDTVKKGKFINDIEAAVVH